MLSAMLRDRPGCCGCGRHSCGHPVPCEEQMKPVRSFDAGASALVIVDMQRKFTDSTEGMRTNTASRIGAIKPP